MLPPILSIRLLTMDMPSPVPWYMLRASMCSCENGSKMCARNASLMPMPVSRITQR